MRRGLIGVVVALVVALSPPAHATARPLILVYGDSLVRAADPCLLREPCTGGVDTHGNRVNRVRSIDGTHFCPVPYAVVDNCPTYASGGERYALGLLVVPLRAHGWYDAQRAALSLGAGWNP